MHLSAIKGVGEAAVKVLLKSGKTTDHYKSIFDLTRRANYAFGE